MRKTLLLIRANFHKEKGQMIVFLLILMLAGMLLNVGLITKFNFDADYEKKFLLDHASAAVLSMYQEEYKPEYLDYIDQYEGVIESEKREIKIVKGEIQFQDSFLEQELLIQDIEQPRKIANHKLIQEYKSPGEPCVYLPYVVKSAGGLDLGDTFQLNINQIPYEFTVAGFYEDYNTGRFSFGYMGIMLDHDSYVRLEEDHQFIYDGILLLERLEDNATNDKFYNDLQRYISLHKNDGEESFKGYSSSQTKTNTMMTAGILIAVVVAFAIVITIISLIIIKFKVKHAIQEEIVDIGSLKAIGYTNFQLIMVYIIQYGGIALIASCLGAMTTNFVLPALSKMITVNAGVIWKQRFDLYTSLFVVLFMCGITSMTAMFSARRVKVIVPIVALHGGITAHNFKKNSFPLNKTRGNLHILLSLKSMIQARHQNVMTILTIAGVSFIACFSLVLYQNMAIDNSHFVDLISGEFSSIRLTIGEGDYDNALKQDVLSQDGVRKVSFYELYGKGYVEKEQPVKLFVSEDFNDIENKKCYEGRDPEFDNEIVLNGCLAKKLGKKVGDIIEVSYGVYSYEYLISGLMQSGNNNGSEGELTIEGYWHINPTYQMRTLNVYTNDGRDVNSVIDSLSNHYGNKFSHYINMDESIDSMSRNFSQMSVALVVAVMIITICIIFLIIYMTTKTAIISQQQEIGIKKAIGYTTLQLKFQLALSILPVVAIGIVLGSILCYIGVNPLISMLMHGMGILDAGFILPVKLMILLCIALLLFVFGISLLITRRIKRISAYKLITE